MIIIIILFPMVVTYYKQMVQQLEHLIHVLTLAIEPIDESFFEERDKNFNELRYG